MIIRWLRSYVKKNNKKIIIKINCQLQMVEKSEWEEFCGKCCDVM